MVVCARRSVLVFYAVFAGFFNFLREKIYGTGRFSGSGADDHQLFFYMALSVALVLFYSRYIIT